MTTIVRRRLAKAGSTMKNPISAATRSCFVTGTKNTPSSATYLWSALSLITLLGGLGTVLFLFGRFDYLGWHQAATIGHSHDNVLTTWRWTPSQRATAWYLAVVAVLFLAQSLLGGVLAHYRVEPGAFYGIDLARVLPYNLARTWHLQLSIFWIATAWVAGGLLLLAALGAGAYSLDARRAAA